MAAPCCDNSRGSIGTGITGCSPWYWEARRKQLSDAEPELVQYKKLRY